MRVAEAGRLRLGEDGWLASWSAGLLPGRLGGCLAN